MEWGKIKTMFIYLFAILNSVLLGFYIYLDFQNKIEKYEEKQAIINSMKNDNITVEEYKQSKEKLTKLLATVKKFSLDSVSNKQDTYFLESTGDSEKLNIKFNNPLTNVNSNYKESVTNFIDKEEGIREDYLFEEYSISDKKIKYRQAFAGLPIYNNDKALLSFEVDLKGDIISATKTAFVLNKLGEEHTIVPYSQVVQKLYHENLIGKNSKVNVDLGYYVYVSQVENQVLVPTWEIRVLMDEKEKIYYVDAFNMKIINN